MSNIPKSSDYIYFWSEKDKKYGYLSQWYTSVFEEKDGTKYNCTEQYMMAKKAILFNKNGDNDKIIGEIMECTSPKRMKALGRKVKNYDEKIWEKNRIYIVFNGNLLKFTQNQDLLTELLKTNDAILAEASPYDKIWGIGVKSKKNLTCDDWKGLNLLGNVLMNVRESLSE